MDGKTRTRVLAIMLVGALLALAAITVATAPPRVEPDGAVTSASFIGASPASASWYFTCGGDSRHRHYWRGVTHIWNLKRVIHKGGKEYHRGTWKTFDWGREKVTAIDMKTYGPC